MAQIQVQKALKQEEKTLQGPPHQPPYSTKSPPPSLPPRPFVSGGEKDLIETSTTSATGVALVTVGGDASRSGTGRVLSMNMGPVSQLSSDNSNSIWSNSSSSNDSNNRSSDESSRVHVECSIIPEAVAGGTRGMTMPMMNKEEERSSLAKVLLSSRSAVAITTATQKVISRTMRRSCDLHPHDTYWTLSYSDNQQQEDRVTVGGKKPRQASSGRTRNGWRSVWALLVLVSSMSAAVVGAPEGYARLENPDGVGYDPLQPHTDQLMLPVVAGVPPANYNNSPDALSKKQQDYRSRLEMDRIEREGFFYVELTPLERQQAIVAAASGAAGSVRYLKEPLPWEGLGEENDDGEDQDGLDGNGIDSEDENSLGWSYSPWGGEFRYEISSDGDGEDEGYDGYYDGEDEFYSEEEEEEEGRRRGPRRKTRVTASQRQRRQQQQQQRHKFSAMAAVDNDDGSSVVEEQDYSRLALTTQPFQDHNNDSKDDNTTAQAKEMTKTLKMEDPGVSGESVTNRDPNIIDNIKEAAVGSQVWDAEGAAQEKSPTGHDGNTHEYAETPLPGSVDATTRKEKGAVNAPGGGGRSFAAEPKSMGSPTTLDGLMEAEVETVRPKLDQIDLLGHEAEIEWLQEQDETQSAWKMKHHHRYNDEDVDEEQDVNGEDDEGGEGPFSSELPPDDPNWYKKHGNLKN